MARPLLTEVVFYTKRNNNNFELIDITLKNDSSK
jgi:hypothetical protein